MAKEVVQSTVVSAQGSASATVGLGKLIEKAMSAAALSASKETEVIWADTKLSEESRRAKMAEVMKPENIKKRMLVARQAVVDASKESVKQ